MYTNNTLTLQKKKKQPRPKRIYPLTLYNTCAGENVINVHRKIKYKSKTQTGKKPKIKIKREKKSGSIKALKSSSIHNVRFILGM